MNTQQIWQAVLGELELSISKANFTTWFKGTFILEIEDEAVVIGVPNAFTKSWLEKKYNKDILTTVQSITDRKFKGVTFVVESIKKAHAKPVGDPSPLEARTTGTREQEKERSMTQKVPTQTVSDSPNSFGINPKYIFDNFIVGKGNELAKAACVAVAANPGQAYNPLFIYGGVGLGKTHLLQSVGNETIKNFPNKKVLYITCEKFTNDFIGSISSGRTTKFKDIYRSVDVLLIDDIQFLAGKEGTQEEFFHTFNALHQNNKQVVISSDRPPKSIPALENRLLTRFEWGMIADISQPDLETRIAILESKIGEKQYSLSQDVLNYLASNIQTNVRELEGALNRIIAYHQLNALPPTLENVKKIIAGLTANLQKKSVTPKEIVQIVSAFYDVSTEDIVGKCRERRLVIPRQIIMFLMREEIKSSYPSIGQELGGRDHTTAMHACQKIQDNYDNDEKTRREIEQIRERLYAF